ncbi:Chitin synthase, class 2 [Actinomortierella ambigua]|nr:Chitin synthase, class 2 [Actinomortierella ambigua]
MKPNARRWLPSAPLIEDESYPSDVNAASASSSSARPPASDTSTNLRPQARSLLSAPSQKPSSLSPSPPSPFHPSTPSRAEVSTASRSTGRTFGISRGHESVTTSHAVQPVRSTQSALIQSRQPRSAEGVRIAPKTPKLPSSAPLTQPENKRNSHTVIHMSMPMPPPKRTSPQPEASLQQPYPQSSGSVGGEAPGHGGNPGGLRAFISKYLPVPTTEDIPSSSSSGPSGSNSRRSGHNQDGIEYMADQAPSLLQRRHGEMYPPLPPTSPRGEGGGSGSNGGYPRSPEMEHHLPSQNTPLYYPLSQWLQAPWLRTAASRISDLPYPSLPMTMAMPMPIHYFFKPKKVKLTDGNLVLDTPVPTRYLAAVEHQTETEFRELRYMAVTCDADLVVSKQYKLRTARPDRPIELAICLTVCKESPQEFCLTLHSLIKNIRGMCLPASKTRAHKNPIWAEPDSWKKIVICIVADGRRVLHPMIFRVLAAMGCWQEGVAKNQVNGKDVQAHIFEYTTQVSVDKNLKLKGRTIKNHNKHHYPPIQIVFCLKERHTRKLNSHRWFFNALCPLLQPRITMITVAGAKIGTDSLYHLWNTFDKDSSIGGACGENRVAKGLLWWRVLNPLIAAQTFEYKVSSVLEKPFESVFGYISVMPGAITAYRYEALLPPSPSPPPTAVSTSREDESQAKGLTSFFKRRKQGQHQSLSPSSLPLVKDEHQSLQQQQQQYKGPLKAYFEPDYLVFNKDEDDDIGDVLKYSYFAEDQILPFLVTTSPHRAYRMKYVRSAWAETELPFGVGSFLGKKRKWQNRRFFGLIYAWFNIGAVWRSGHNWLRKLMLTLEIVYLACDTVFWFLALGNYYIVFYYMSKSLATATKLSASETGFTFIRYIYICLIVVVMMISMGNRPRGHSLYLFILSFIFFAFIQAYILFSAGYLTFQHATEFLPYADWKNFETVVRVFKASGYHILILALVCCYGVYFLSALLYGDPWHLIACFVQFLFLLPSYVSVLGVYAFCNMHKVRYGFEDRVPTNDTKSSASSEGKGVLTAFLIVASLSIIKISWGIKAKEDPDKDPLIHRTEIYHASTVHVPDEQSVESSYEEACENLRIHDLQKFRLFSSPASILPLHHSNNKTSASKQKSSTTGPKSNASGVPSSSAKAKKPKESKDEKKARLLREKEQAKLAKLTTKKQNSYRYRTDLETLQSDFYQRFRTRILLLWIIANGALVISITADELAPYLILEDGSNLYVTLVVWIVTAGAAGRFFGTVAYLNVSTLETYSTFKLKLTC